MKFVIAPDSFKGGLTAKEAAEVIADGIKRVYPDAEYVLVPMADGGEGTVQSLIDATNGRKVTARVHNPLNKLVTAEYGLLGNSKTAVIEMAAASGLQFVDENTANPLITTTYGTGELVKDALNHGVEKIIIGIGGSATVDGGAGLAQALGARLLDADNREIGLGGGALKDLAQIDFTHLDSRLKKVTIQVASDVTNPLTGKDGAAAVFGPQKGADEKMVDMLDKNLHHYAQKIVECGGADVEEIAGAGAAGGLGAGLVAFTGAIMKRGVELVIEATQLRKKAIGADYVFTGEGGIDFQTKFGKTPYGVAQATKKVAPDAPVIVLAGNIGKGVDELYSSTAIDAIFATPEGAKPLKQALIDAPADIARTAENVARLIKASS
ncbi:glycerate kinase [Limosilactobacillus sp. RRLNB_1_1]|uniref:Glycerate kinase n=1 Tax=Limosilactobacillus albertensis TaxID=2759752 RepID=A0A7W3TQZ4_9LACO|nr:glycerate kinase [Limosilactobacillus albertensis]MBB1069302.1 glycerate kinase [Limosilactobacillus albertensis]MCD7118398.1 glycerate kinase [Limosilactobacillus albertensis]MCD7128541.1 glycerate kinase [Limosilactobacillus albertensis]